jgi:iron complex outermembrane recepter protein
MKKGLCAHVLCMVMLQGYAQQNNIADSITTNAQIEVKAVRSNSKAPFAKTNITKSFIEKHNTVVDLPFMLQQVPGVVVQSDAGNGVGYTGLRIRGTDASRINVTLNGVPFNDAESQGSFFVNMPDILSSTENIQVQRGVGGSTNGAGAFGASIHLNTFSLPEKAGLQFNNSAGSFNTFKHTLKLHSGRIDKYFFADARVSYIKSNGYIDRASSNLCSYYISTSFQKQNTSITFNSFSGKEKTYQAWYGVDEVNLKTNRTFNSAGTERANNPYENETDNYTQTHYQLIARQKIKDITIHATAFLVKGLGYYEQYKAAVNYSSLNLPNSNGQASSDIIRQLWLDNNFYGINYTANYIKNAWDVIYGGSISAYKGKHFGKVIWAANGGIPNNFTYYNNLGNKQDINQFVKAHYAINKTLTAYADLQARFVQYTINGFRNNPTLNVDKKFAFVNPKIGLQWQQKSNTWFISIAKAAKEPNRDDFEAGITQLPKPEKLYDIELGYETTIAQKLFIAATYYYMHYKDQLILTGKINDVGAQTRTNVPKSYRTGIELIANYNITKKVTIKSNIALSKNIIKKYIDYTPDYDNNAEISKAYNNTQITLSPNTVINITPCFENKRWYIEWQNQWVGRQYLDNTANKEKSLKAYYNANLLARYSIGKKSNVHMFMQFNNIFNNLITPNGYTYSYVYGGALSVNNFYYPMASINFLAGVNITL